MTDIEYLKKYLSKEKLDEGILKLNEGIPVQYIVGNVDFFGYNFIVNEDVLIPRFETEELVEKTIKIIKEKYDKNIRILDIGTGSGCIAITLKKKLPDTIIDAVDISDSALEVAKKNAKNNNVEINFIKSDLFENVNKKYDVIISNPPYISYDEEIMDIVKKNEPNIALYAEDNGLYFYNKIIDQSSKYLKDNGLIAFEIGYLQGKEIQKKALMIYKKVIIEKDLQNKDRFIFIKK